MSIQVFKPKYRTKEVLKEIEECLEIGWTGSGFKTEQLEQAWKDYTYFENAHFDLSTIYLAKDSLKYFPFGSFLGFVFLIEILIVVPNIFDSANPYTTNFLSNYHSD